MILSQIKSWFSQTYSNFLCAAPHIPPHCQYTLSVSIPNCSLLFLSNFLCQCVFFFQECFAISLSRMSWDSGSLIFVSLANLAISRYHPILLFSLSVTIALYASFFQEEKRKGKLCFCPNVGSMTWCPETSDSQETWGVALVLPPIHDTATGLSILPNKNCDAFSDLLRLNLITNRWRSWKYLKFTCEYFQVFLWFLLTLNVEK